MAASLLGIVGLGLGGCILGLLGLLRPGLMRSWTFLAAPWFVFAGAAGLALASEQPSAVWFPGILAGVWLLSSTRLLQFLQRPIVACVALSVACPALACLWADLTAPPVESWEPPANLEVRHTQIKPSPFETDLGRPIPAYVPTRPATPEELAQVAYQTKLANLICTDVPSADYNCHGWVFTGGRCWINSDQVAFILEDNGYKKVSQPKAGDLIVYRDLTKIVHTGIVRAADEFGVLIESKFDSRGRYIHTPEHQDYAVDFDYYRSDRPGHVVRAARDSSPRPALGARPRLLAQ